MAFYSNIIKVKEGSWAERVEVFVRCIKQSQSQIKSDMKLAKKDVHIVGFFSPQKISDVFVARQF